MLIVSKIVEIRTILWRVTVPFESDAARFPDKSGDANSASAMIKSIIDNQTTQNRKRTAFR